MWTGALLRRAGGLGAFAAVLRRGDPVAGAVLLVHRTHGAPTRVYARVAHAAEPGWEVARETAADDEAAVDEYLTRQARYDPDLWVLELTGGEIEQLVGERLVAR